MTTDTELGRVINALTATLNDQRDERFDEERIQTIVTEALGGEEALTASPDPHTPRSSGWLIDEQGRRVVAIRHEHGGWRVERCVEPVGEAPVPSPPPARDKARMQAKQGRVPLAAAAVLAAVVFVVLFLALDVALWLSIVVAVAVLALAGAAGMRGKQALSS